MIHHERYNFLTKNHVPFENMLPINELKKNLTQVKNYDGIIESFYENSKKIIDDFVNLVNVNKNEKTIIFISGKPFPMLSRQALAMKCRGYKTFLISMNQINLNDYLLIKDSFDQTIQNILFFPALKKILNSISPDFYHVQCWMWKYSLGKFVINNKRKSKVICDFYDVTGIYAEKKDLKIVFDEEIVEQDLECEKFIFKNADGIIHRYKQKVFLDYSKRYNRKQNILEFQQYPLSSKNIVKKKKGNSRVRLVYCGTLIPPNDPNHPKELFPPAGMADAFNILILKNFEINIYLPINGCKNFNNWIFDLKKKFPENLYIHETLPIDELIKQISVYDYGINFYILNKKETKVSDFTFNGGMGTKYFTLLEAGLPIIVNSEMKYINELVKKNKIGISLNSKDFHLIDRYIKKINYPELKKNVKKFKLKNNLFVKSDELVSFYSSL